MKDPQRTARTLRAIADIVENPEAQAELAERVVAEGQQQLRAGLQTLLDRWMPRNPKK
jgi:hypothetical protein